MNLAARTLFDYGTDGTFQPVKNRNGELVPSGFPVNFQLKSTTQWERNETEIIYDLDARAHRNLTDRERGETMSILILLCLPKEAHEWIEGCEEYLRLSHCCYWFRPPGPPTQNASKIRVRIPRSNILTPDSLRHLMSVAREEALAGL